MNGLLKFFVGFLITVALFACNQEIPATQIETDLELKVSASTNNIQVGNPFTYTVTVKNIGANAATEVKVIDPIPQNASYVSASSSQGSCNLKDATLTCMLGKIAVNDAANVKLVLTSSTVGKIQNTASVTSTEIDTSTTNNIASSSITLDAVPPQANLQLLGTAAPNPVQVGKNLTYTFKITNAGPDGASAIKFSDLLSQNISYVSSVTTQGTCSFAKSTLSCDLNSLALNATAEVKLIVIPNTTGTVTDTSTLRGAEVDPNTANNTTTVSATVQTPPAAPEANLGLSMTAAPNPVQTGQNLTYTLELTNAGPNDATNTKIINPLPQNTSYVSSSASQGSCAVANGSLTCDLGSLATTASAQVSLVLTSSVVGTITNSASATATESDPNTANNTASASATVQLPPKADLKTTITATPNPVQTGQNISYTLKVNNIGPNDASNVKLTDALPANTSFVSSSASQGACSLASNTVTCSLGAIATGATAQATVVLTSSLVGTLKNTASATGTETDPVSTNNSASVSITVQAPPPPKADLGITITATPNPVQVGQNLTYTLNVTNNGPDSASTVKLSDVLPANTSHVSSSASQGSCSFTTGTLSCALGTLALNTSAKVTLILTSSVAGTLGNTSTVSATEADPVSTNNTANTSVTVQTPPTPKADLSVSASAAPNPVQTGQNLTYTINIGNAGADAATNVKLSSALPQNTSYVTSSANQGTCGMTNGTFDCALGNLAVNASTQVTLVLTSSAAGTLNTSFGVTANETDPNSSNNTAAVSVTIQAPPAPKADLGLTIAATPNPVQTGQNLTYTLHVSNAGPNTATNVNLTDTLPQNTAFVSSNPSQSCGVTNGIFSCNLGSLALNATAQITLVLTSSAAGTLSNSSSVTATEADPNTANNAASTSVTVNAPPAPKADLNLIASATPNPVVTGANLTYTFSVNNAGPDAASSVTLGDVLPANTSYVSSNASQGLCGVTGGKLTCNLGNLALNGSAQVTLVLTSSTVGTLSNSATASATETDPNTANNTASATVNVQAPTVLKANLGLTLSATPNPVQTGQNLTYTFTVSNAGPDDANGVNLTDPIPQNASYVSSSTTQGLCSNNAGTFGCALGVIKANASVQVTLVISSSVAGTLSNTASVSATETDPDTANNSASASVTIQTPPSANLGLTMTATPNPVVIGKNLSYTITVTNAGPDAATNTQLSDTLPANTSYVSSNFSVGSCTFATAKLSCGLGTLAVNATAQVTLVLTSSTTGTLTNTASVSATESDPVTTNNTSSLNVTVQNPIIPGSINLPPTGKISWDWQIGASGDSNVVVPSGAVLMDVDGFNISAAKIANLKAQGIYTVCYLDVGSWEPGRPDSDQYPAYLKIFYDSQWAEWFLDINDVWKPNSVLATILRNRFKMCADKGFDSIEPDNLQNDENVTTGVITTQNQIDFNGWVADNAHAYNLAVFQKNGPDKILLKDKTGKMMVDKFDAILNEECQQYAECAPLAEYVKRGKLALNVEYTQTLDCALSNSIVMNSIKKDLGLTGGNMSGYQRQTCP